MQVQLFNGHYIRTCLMSQEQKQKHKEPSVPLHGTSCKENPPVRWHEIGQTSKENHELTSLA